MSNRSTTRRNKWRNAWRKTGAPCALCGQPIDYDLPHLDPGAFVVDHITPLHRGGPDVLANTQPAHRSCNRAKGARLDGGPIIRHSATLKRPR